MRPQKIVIGATIQKRQAAKGKRWVVRWRLDGREFSRSFTTSEPANDFHLELRNALKNSEPFDEVSGEPSSWAVGAKFLTAALDWYHRQYAAWAPATRSNMANALGLVVIAMASPDLPEVDRRAARRVLGQRCVPGSPHVPNDAEQTAWRALTSTSRPLSAIDARACEVVLNRLATKDGFDSKTKAAAATFSQRRLVLSGVLSAAVAEGAIASSPLANVLRGTVKLDKAVTAAEIPTVEQALVLLDTIGNARTHGDNAYRLKTFLAVTLYAGLRPGEVSGLRPGDITQPGPDDNGWGSIRVSASVTTVNKRFSDDGTAIAQGPLKHRAVGTTRIVPAPPVLMALLNEYLATSGPSANGFLLRNRNGELLGDGLQAPLARARKRLGWVDDHALAGVTHYTLRHTNASTMLQVLQISEVAKRLGHSEMELLRTYTNVFHASTAASNEKLDGLF